MADELVLVEQGVCPIPTCDGAVEAADGLVHYLCGRGHDAVHYDLVDTYAMDARKAWADG